MEETIYNNIEILDIAYHMISHFRQENDSAQIEPNLHGHITK